LQEKNISKKISVPESPLSGFFVPVALLRGWCVNKMVLHIRVLNEKGA
jgi:hypothetical protein